MKRDAHSLFVLVVTLVCTGCGSAPSPRPDAILDVADSGTEQGASGDPGSQDLSAVDATLADLVLDSGHSPVDPALRLRLAGWLSGDLHLHSDYSGGEDPVKVVVALAEYYQTPAFLAFHPEYAGNPVDFIALTDHRMVKQNADPDFHSDTVVLIPGEEFGGPGHAEIWGLKTFIDHDPGGDGSTLADYATAVDAAHAQGALFSMNHPQLKGIPFPWDIRSHDAMEVWNTRWALQGSGFTSQDLAAWEAANGPASPFFRRAVAVQGEGGSGQFLRFYEAQLCLGIHVALVGGSDRHILFPIGFPATWVLAPTRDTAGILDGIQKRHTFVSRSPAGATVEMTVEVSGTRYLQGDQIPVPHAGAEATVTVTVGRADKGRVRIVRGSRVSDDAALAAAPLGTIAFETAVDGIDFTAKTTLTLNPGDWLYPVVHERLVPEGLDPALAAQIPEKIAKLSEYSEENYAPIIEALMDFVDTGVLLAPDTCDPADWQATHAQCILADTTGMASFFFPDWIDRFLNALIEDGKVSDWSMGAVGSAVVAVSEPATAEPVPDALDASQADAPELPDIDPGLDSDGDGLPDLQEYLLGTDPHRRDSDSDGIEDGAEVADGTDPTNPAEAKAWQPEWTVHPRLFFGPEDLPELRARAAAAEGPWAVLWDRLQGLAGQTPPVYPDGAYDVTLSPRLGAIAEAAAFLGLILEDAAMTDKALDVLATPYPDPTDTPPDSKYDLYEAEALVAMCSAYDLLAGNPLASPDKLAAARATVTKRIDECRYLSHEGSQLIMLLFSRNNHPMKVFGAFGLCAMAINDRPEAAADLSEAMTGLDFLLNFYQASQSEGGYAEGWNYLVYGSNSYLPFFAAYHRYAKGATFPYYGVPPIQAESPHWEKVDPIPDFAVNPRTRTIFRRALASSRPDGLMPNTDDANPSALHGGLAAWLFDDPLYLWQWFKPAAGFQAGRAEVASFCLYDGTPPPADPGADLSGSWPDAGFSIVRSDWGPEAFYLVLQGEQGNVRIHGEGHEHPDELSFLLWAYGRELILDPGYINWEHHDLVKLSTDHNTILVDGLGSPYGQFGDAGVAVGADAFLTPMTHEGRTRWVSVSTEYQGTAFTRRVVVLADRFVVLDDLAIASKGHVYSFLLNGTGGGDVPDSAFSLLPDGGRWDQPGAWVEAHVLPVTGEASRSHDLQEHATVWGAWALHERLIVDAAMTTPAGFLSVLVPGKTGEEALVVTMTRPQPGVVTATWTADGTIWRVVTNRTGTAVQVGSADFGPGLTVLAEDGSGAVLESHTIP